MTAPRDPWEWSRTIKPARWLSVQDTTEHQRAGAVRALADVGVCETPWLYGGVPNRSGYIDECLKLAGVPQAMIEAGKGWWCAAMVGRWWADVGLRVPTGYASCDNWLTWHPGSQARAWLDAQPTVGAAILYGAPSLTGPVVYAGQRYDAHHIGLVVRVIHGRTPDESFVVTVEGNAAWGGTFTANGEAVVVRKVPLKNPKIIGYVPMAYAE